MIREKIKQYVDKCVEHVISNTVWSIIVYFVGIVCLNIPQIFSYFAQIEWLTIVAAILSLFSIVLFVVVLWILRKAFHKPKQDEEFPINLPLSTDEPLQPDEDSGVASIDVAELLDDINFTKVTTGMNIKQAKDIEYTMKYDGIVNCDELDEFPKQLNWSGSRYIKTELVHCNYEARLEDNIGSRDKPPYQIKICFEEDIPCGQRVTFTTKTYVADDNKKMLPISSFYVKYPIDELIMELTAPKGILYHVRIKCYKDAAREVMLWQSKNATISEVGNLKKYTFLVPAPQPWRYYSVEWIFSEQY